MAIQDLEIIQVPSQGEEDPKNLRKKSLTGRFPLLETDDNVIICDQLPIAKFLSFDHPTFLGSSPTETAQIEMWIDFVNANILPAAKRVLDMVRGVTQSDVKTFSICLNELKATLGSLDAHLALRNFLVGHQMTMADALLVTTLSPCFELVLDKKTRDSQIQNLARYTTLILKMAPCVRVFGSPLFCKDVVQPNFNLDKTKEKKEKAQPEKAAKKKDKKPDLKKHMEECSKSAGAK